MDRIDRLRPDGLCCVTPIFVLLPGVIVLEAIWQLETETAAKLVEE